MPTKMRSMIRWLRRHFPVRTPVVVRVARRMPEHNGYCLFYGDRALIRIAAATEQVMEDTLLEEWSHLVRYEVGVPVEDNDEHDAIFWAILGAITKKWRG